MIHAFRPRTSRATASAALVAALHAAIVASPLTALAQRRAEPSRPAQAAPAGDLVARGRALYDDQRYEESVQALSAALLRPATSQEDKVETYRLLAYNFIVLGRQDEADAAVRGLLALQPDFQLPRRESPRFRDFFAAARTKWEADGRPGVVTAAKAPPKPVRLEHTSPAESKSGTEVVLRGRVDDPDARVDSVRVLYRTGSSGKFTEAPASLDAGEFRVTLPPAAVQPPLVEYYLEALDKGRLPVADRGDAGAPLRVVVAAPEPGIFASPWLWAGAGAVVVGGIAAALLLGKKSSDASAAAPGGGASTSHVTVTVGE